LEALSDHQQGRLSSAYGQRLLGATAESQRLFARLILRKVKASAFKGWQMVALGVPRVGDLRN